MGGVGGIKELAAAITCLQVAPVAEDIEELLALRDRLDAKLSEALRVFEAELGWAEDGSLSLTAWLAANGRRSRKDAHREAVTAKRLSSLPTTAAAWAEGVLSWSQVGAVVANVSAEHAGLYAAHPCSERRGTWREATSGTLEVGQSLLCWTSERLGTMGRVVRLRANSFDSGFGNRRAIPAPGSRALGGRPRPKAAGTVRATTGL
jgi:hypothetical protein